METAEILARALCRQYNRGFEDATDDNPYGGADSAEAQEEYLAGLIEENWNEWAEEAQELLKSLRPQQA
jgi:hypothetical protein